MKYRIEAQLLNPTNKKWALYKSLNRQIEEIANKEGVTVLKTEYDNKLFIKIMIYETNNDGETGKVLFEVGNYLGYHNLKINIISRIEILSTVKKIKYVIKLIDSTPAKWRKYIALEPKIQKFAEDEDILRENVR